KGVRAFRPIVHAPSIRGAESSQPSLDRLPIARPRSDARAVILTWEGAQLFQNCTDIHFRWIFLFTAMIEEIRRSPEPMCALDPLLLIPRIEYVKDIYDFVVSQPRDYHLVILDMKNFHFVNDIYGYDIGDVVIEQFMRKLRSGLPAGSISLRFRHGD